MFHCAAPLVIALALASQTAPTTTRIDLPAELAYPEGIALDPKGDTAYVAGAADGRIVRVDLRTRKATVLGAGIADQLGGAFPAVLGLELDRRGRLWIAGGRTGKVFVADARTGKLIGSFATQTAPPSFPNDLAIVGDTAYFTDTIHPTLWSAAVGAKLPARATPWLSFAGTPLEYAAAPNLNGIAATPDGRSLIVVQMNKGLLFRIDIATKAVTPIDLKGEKIDGTDGLVLKGDLLFGVRQQAAEIVTVRLDPGLASGTLLKRTKVEALRAPATAALSGDGKGLWVVNTQFSRRAAGNPELPFFLTHVPLSLLGAE